MQKQEFYFENELFQADRPIILETHISDSDLENNILAIAFQSCILIKNIETEQILSFIQDIDICCKLKLSPDGSKLFCVDVSGARIYDTQTGEVINPLTKLNLGISFFYNIHAADYSADGKYIGFMTNNKVIIWDLHRSTFCKIFVRGGGNILKFSPLSQKVAFSITQNDVELYDLINDDIFRTYTYNIEYNGIWSCDFSSDDKFIALGLGNYEAIFIYDIASSGKPRYFEYFKHSNPASNNPIKDVKFMGSGSYFCTLNQHGTIRFYLNRTEEPLFLQSHTRTYNISAFGKLFASDNIIYLLSHMLNSGKIRILNFFVNTLDHYIKMNLKQQILQGAIVVPYLFLTKDKKYLVEEYKGWNLETGKVSSKDFRNRNKVDYDTDIEQEEYFRINENTFLWTAVKNRYVIIYKKKSRDTIISWQAESEERLFGRG